LGLVGRFPRLKFVKKLEREQQRILRFYVLVKTHLVKIQIAEEGGWFFWGPT